MTGLIPEHHRSVTINSITCRSTPSHVDWTEICELGVCQCSAVTRRGHSWAGVSCRLADLYIWGEGNWPEILLYLLLVISLTFHTVTTWKTDCRKLDWTHIFYVGQGPRLYKRFSSMSRCCAQLTICAQKWRNFVLFSMVSFRFVLSRVCVFLYSLGP